MEENVKITSMATGSVSVNLPDLRFSRTWPRKGSVITVPKAILREGIFDEGLNNMLKAGVLFIDDLEFKKELGLEPEDAVEPVNVILLEDKFIERLLKYMPLGEFKTEYGKLTQDQRIDVAHYAITHTLIDFDKDAVIKQRTGIDVIKGIDLNKQNTEVLPEQN